MIRDELVTFVHPDDPCTVCQHQSKSMVEQKMYDNWSKFYKDETNYQINSINMNKKFTWLVEHLTAHLSEDLPGSIKVGDYVKGCQVDLPDLACFNKGNVKYIAKTDEDG